LFLHGLWNAGAEEIVSFAVQGHAGGWLYLHETVGIIEHALTWSTITLPMAIHTVHVPCTGGPKVSSAGKAGELRLWIIPILGIDDAGVHHPRLRLWITLVSIGAIGQMCEAVIEMVLVAIEGAEETITRVAVRHVGIAEEAVMSVLMSGLDNQRKGVQ
jgi:hypothetical protein